MRKLVPIILLSLVVSTTLVAAATLDVTPISPITNTESDYSIGTAYSFYGTYEGYERDHPSYMRDAGSRYDRLDFSWDRIESTRGAFSFSGHDRIVELDADNDLSVIGILMSTAHWATSGCPATASNLTGTPEIASRLQNFRGGDESLLGTDDVLPWCPYAPNNLYLDWNHPDNYWGQFVYTTALYYNTPGNPQIDIWEVWNEPDWDLFWRGSEAEYAQLLKVAYQAIKAANPNATVLFGGLFYWIDTQWYKDVLPLLPTLDGAENNNYFFDALSLHQYSNVYNIGWVTEEINAQMESTVGTHPIWITETGVPLCDEPGFSQSCSSSTNHATADEAAYYAIQAYAEARAAGVEKFIWFRAHDEAMGEAFGLMRNDATYGGIYRPAYPALQVAARYLHGENQITGPLSDGTARRISFWGTGRGLIDVIWNTSPNDTTISRPASVPTATLVNHMGETQTLTAINDRFTIDLYGATANTGDGGSYIIGGPPILLIQQDTIAPTSTLHALPSTTYSDTVTLSWDVFDSSEAGAGSGYWYAEIEASDSPTGPWTQIAGWGDTQYVTSTNITYEQGSTWHYRIRIRDRCGNWEEFPTTAETGTTLILTRSIDLNASTFVDANHNGIRDPEEAAPATLPTYAWSYHDGTAIAGVTAATWHYQTVMHYGDTWLKVNLPGFIAPWQDIFVATGPLPQQITVDVPVTPIITTIFFPMVNH